MTIDLAALRKDYALHGLRAADLHADPIEQFNAWMKAAVAAEGSEANAMTLATATADARPSARIVLLKQVDARGFTFFTNYDSRKGGQLDENPHAALVFWWRSLERQVRIEGQVEKVGPEASDAYFAVRPLESRLGAWASPQSQVIPDRETLERALADAAAKFEDGDVPRPPHWGGYRVVPGLIEFWQGRPGRLHDRLRYCRDGEDDAWRIERLAP